MFSLNWAWNTLARLVKSSKSSLWTSVRARQEAVFMWTSLPRLALPLTKQNGTFFFLQRAGRKQIISMGSTSWAITTSLALFSSTRVVTWLRPYLMWRGLAVLVLSPLAAASADNLAFFSARDSGLYLGRSLKSLLASFLSTVDWN